MFTVFSPLLQGGTFAVLPPPRLHCLLRLYAGALTYRSIDSDVRLFVVCLFGERRRLGNEQHWNTSTELQCRFKTQTQKEELRQENNMFGNAKKKHSILLKSSSCSGDFQKKEVNVTECVTRKTIKLKPLVWMMLVFTDLMKQAASRRTYWIYIKSANRKSSLKCNTSLVVVPTTEHHASNIKTLKGGAEHRNTAVISTCGLSPWTPLSQADHQNRSTGGSDPLPAPFFGPPQTSL